MAVPQRMQVFGKACSLWIEMSAKPWPVKLLERTRWGITRDLLPRRRERQSMNIGTEPGTATQNMPPSASPTPPGPRTTATNANSIRSPKIPEMMARQTSLLFHFDFRRDGSFRDDMEKR